MAAAGEAGATPTEPEVAKKGKPETLPRQKALPRRPTSKLAGGEEVSTGGNDASDSGDVGPGPFLWWASAIPDSEYLWTPHNAGFMAIDRIAQQEGVVVQNRRCRAVTATCRIGRARSDPGQAGDIYESERAFSGRSGSGV